jgi:hypothetical protein
MGSVGDTRLRFRVLGPVEALDPHGERIAIRGQPLRLLGLLLVRRGQLVTPDAAIEALWGDKLPAHPENALQLVVSRLRRSLGADAVTWDVAGYALHVSASEAVDADRFERLLDDGEEALRAGQPTRAAEVLEVASELWRGPAFQGVAYESRAAAPGSTRNSLSITPSASRTSLRGWLSSTRIVSRSGSSLCGRSSTPAVRRTH